MNKIIVVFYVRGFYYLRNDKFVIVMTTVNRNRKNLISIENCEL